MRVRYHDVEAEAHEAGLRVRCRIENTGRSHWRAEDGFVLGWQVYDPATGIFISEGEWTRLPEDVPPGASRAVEMDLHLPEEEGQYRVYLSGMDSRTGWYYTRGEPLVVVDAEASGGMVRLLAARATTLRALRWRGALPALRRLLIEPFTDLWTNRGLIRSMARREILARYRGSFGDVLWTILHPLLLMLAYFFVFGVVLQSRFGNDPIRTGFALYFLAGMLPWLAFSEPAARSAFVIVEHRNFVKKLVFPVSTLPVNQVIAGLVTALLAMALFAGALILVRGGVPATAFLVPVLLIPQLLFTLGVCWSLAAMGVFFRDLPQVMPFLLTLWFFLTPICYPEASLPAAAVPILAKNPMFQLVRGYRRIFLEGQAPVWIALGKLWVLSALVFLGGYGLFARLRKTFADVV
ncbi:MAG: ABC transporter permease [Acidobacteria bacterium]|nr:ABC transporter permease [Acidobacteriota bacterium]